MSHLDPDVCADLLADRQRREILTALRRTDTASASVLFLVDSLFETAQPSERRLDRQQRPDTPHGQSPDEQQTTRHRLTIDLIHSQLPRLAAGGLIEYNPNTLWVRYCADPQVDALLDIVATETYSGAAHDGSDRTVTTPSE
jgi:hypothetical protein